MVTTTVGTENRDASTGQKIDSDIDKEHDERHYASGSGKPDTTIIEANAEGIKCKNYQFAQTGLRPSCTSKLYRISRDKAIAFWFYEKIGLAYLKHCRHCPHKESVWSEVSH
jgi:hypothetical protein